MTLYEIDAGIKECFDPVTGELIDFEKFEALAMAREDKIESVVLWIKDLKAEAEALKAEEKAFTERRKDAENKAESLRKWLAGVLDGRVFKTAKAAVTFRKTKSVRIDDASKLDAEFLRYKEPEPDKTAIKKAIEDGRKVEGAELVEGLSMTVK